MAVGLKCAVFSDCRCPGAVEGVSVRGGQAVKGVSVRGCECIEVLWKSSCQELKRRWANYSITRS